MMTARWLGSSSGGGTVAWGCVARCAALPLLLPVKIVVPACRLLPTLPLLAQPPPPASAAVAAGATCCKALRGLIAAPCVRLLLLPAAADGARAGAGGQGANCGWAAQDDACAAPIDKTGVIVAMARGAGLSEHKMVPFPQKKTQLHGFSCVCRPDSAAGCWSGRVGLRLWKGETPLPVRHRDPRTHPQPLRCTGTPNWPAAPKTDHRKVRRASEYKVA